METVRDLLVAHCNRRFFCHHCGYEDVLPSGGVVHQVMDTTIGNLLEWIGGTFYSKGFVLYAQLLNYDFGTRLIA